MIRMSESDKFEYFRGKFAGEQITDFYANFRPTYPNSIYEKIKEFHDQFRQGNDNGHRQLAVDVGCGPGISTIPLTKTFQYVIGVDVSPDQVSHAHSNIPGLSFRVGRGEDLNFIEDNSVDLVTNAASLHWLPIEKYYAELNRVLKSGGTFAAYTYTYFIDVITKDKEVQSYIHNIYNNVLLNLNEPDIVKSIDSFYYSMPQPFDGWERKQYMTVYKDWSVTQVVGFMKSWPAYKYFARQNPHRDLFSEIMEKLSLHGYCDKENKDLEEEPTFKIGFHFGLLMARKP